MECCIEDGCDNCPYCEQQTAFCDERMMKDALDLINRQQTENERLKNRNINNCRNWQKKYNSLKSEAYKEFAEYVTIKLVENYTDKYCHWIDDTIDKLLREMVGEQRKEDEEKMKEQEAIEFIKNKIQIDVRFCTDEDIENTKTALNIAINALEKQMPKEPLTKTLANDGYAGEWICPNCRIVKVTTEKQFCDDCGQRIDWSYHPTEKGGVQE